MSEINPLFAFHKINASGQKIARDIAEDFSALAQQLETLGALSGREGAIAKTKLEEACFFAKKAMAVKPENQEPA